MRHGAAFHGGWKCAIRSVGTPGWLLTTPAPCHQMTVSRILIRPIRNLMHRKAPIFGMGFSFQLNGGRGFGRRSHLCTIQGVSLPA